MYTTRSTTQSERRTNANGSHRSHQLFRAEAALLHGTFMTYMESYAPRHLVSASIQHRLFSVSTADEARTTVQRHADAVANSYTLPRSLVDAKALIDWLWAVSNGEEETPRINDEQASSSTQHTENPTTIQTPVKSASNKRKRSMIEEDDADNVFTDYRQNWSDPLSSSVEWSK